MSTIILACETIKDELERAIEKTKADYPVYYIESGLHNNPSFLHQRIQEEIDKKENATKILMAFGYCGNSMLGIKSTRAKLIIPKIDDCISLLLGSAEDRKKLSRQMGTYFLTKGWLQYESNLITEYERCVEKYGQGRALRIMKSMLGNYKRFMVINTGAYPVDSIIERTLDFAAKLNITHEVYDGSPRLFHKLLLGPWDDEFIVLEPGQEFTLEDLVGNDNAGQLSV